MKRNNKKLTTLILAGALCAAMIGGAGMLDKTVTTAADETTTEVAVSTEKLTNLFTLSAGSTIQADNETTMFELADGGNAVYGNDLAFKWYSESKASYLTIKFAFKTLDFDKVTFTVQSASAWATANKTAENVVTFTNTNGAISVKVNDGAAVATSITAGSDVMLALTEGAEDGEFGVMVNNNTVGKFENVGENYANVYDETDKTNRKSLKIEADVKEGAEKVQVLLKDINGQSFENVSKDSNNSLIVSDTAAPVLVVNEEVGSFLLGTAIFANFDYTKIDVLQSTSLTETKTFYQYNPTDDKADGKYKTLLSTTYCYPTAYEKDGESTTVYKEEGCEYVSIKIKLGDKTFKDDKAVEYDLAWYATEEAVVDKNGVDYILLDRNTQGATYSHLELDDENGVNKIINAAAYETAKEEFGKSIEEIAAKTYAGGTSELKLPSIKWLIDDNDGYRNLKFTISYKSPSSSTATSLTKLSYNALEIPVANEGWYEFKIFAIDAADNGMMYYLDGELVKVAAGNVWKIEEIPSFSFQIKDKGLMTKLEAENTEKEAERKASKVLDQTYTMSAVTVVGASNLKSEYKLYRVKSNNLFSASTLSGITYQALRMKAASMIDTAEGNYFEAYLDAYAALIAEKVGGKVTAEAVKACFTEIEAFDDRIDKEDHAAEWEKNNKYNWNPTARSFTTAEEGEYVILADYWEAELPEQRVPAYKVVIVDSEADTIDGEKTSWVEKNVVSVILFSVAGVMLILIIILLLVKPSDETMEDVDKKAEKKAAKKKADKKSDKTEE